MLADALLYHYLKTLENVLNKVQVIPLVRKIQTGGRSVNCKVSLPPGPLSEGAGVLSW